MLYHGSPKQFSAFSKEVEVRRTENETNTLGIWLTDKISAAKPFAIGTEAYQEVSTTHFWDDGKPYVYNRVKVIEGYLYEVTLRDVTLMEFNTSHLGVDSFETFMAYRDQYCEYIGAGKGQRSWKERFVLMNTKQANQDFIENLKSKGYDGFVIRNTEYDEKGENIDQYCIFDEANITIQNVTPIGDYLSEEEREEYEKDAKNLHYAF